MRRDFFDEDLHGTQFDVGRFTNLLQEQDVNDVPAIISTILWENAKGERKIRWGDKTPYYILHLDTLLEMFPEAQFIHIVRDGRDCAISMLDRARDLRIFNAYHAAYLWNRYVGHGTRFGARHPGIYKEIRYEDLIDDGYAVTADLCRFLGIEFSDSVINFRKSDGSGKTPLLTKPLQKDNKGKWRKAMSRRQLRVFESVAGEMLAAKDYERAISDAHLGRLEETLYNAHIRLCHVACRRR